MSAPLYTTDILRLAASISHHERLARPQGTSEKRSPVCGSRMTVDIDLDSSGRVSAVGLLVRACALGQAASSLLAADVLGKSPDELAKARDAVSDWLTGGGELPGWPGLAALARARDYPARHASIRLAFEAAAEAAAMAQARTTPGDSARG